MPRFDKSSLVFKSSHLMEDAPDKSDVLDTNQVRVVAEDGRTAFTIRLGEDGTSIEIATAFFVNVGGKMYEGLAIRPTASNRINVELIEQK